jgi:SagB-type dehydrogenase family enzyme
MPLLLRNTVYLPTYNSLHLKSKFSQMKKNVYIIIIFSLLVFLGIGFTVLFRFITPSDQVEHAENEILSSSIIHNGNMITLPTPNKKGNVSLEQALSSRRSVRQYAAKPLSAENVSQLLWSAQGVTNERGFRTAPSAGATFPLEMFVLVNNVTGLQKGIYHYNPFENSLHIIHLHDVSAQLAKASFSQSMIQEGGAVFIFGAVFERTTQRYNDRGIRYVYNEIGHASQNLHLQAAALNLGTVAIGAFQDEEVEGILNLDPEIRVLYMMPVGSIDF